MDDAACLTGHDDRDIRALALLTLLLVTSGCAGASGRASPRTHAAARAGRSARRPTIVALGDSVPRGTACECTPYPELTGADLGASIGHRIRTSNEAADGAVSDDVVRQLDTDTATIRHARDAYGVLLEVGANDVAHSSQCDEDLACYEGALPGLRDNLTTAVSRVRELARGHDVTVVLLGYWSVWLGGQYAAARGPAYADTARSLTLAVNETIRSVASATGCPYVDLQLAFRGPDDVWDETHLLAADGEHPNAAGHERIAEAVARTLRP